MRVRTPSGYILFIKAVEQSIAFTAGAEDRATSDILKHTS